MLRSACVSEAVLTCAGKSALSRKFEAILAARGVSYRQGGRFEIMVRCPMCGGADPSEHLSVSTRNRGWRCLRNPAQHKGVAYARLLSLLVGCSIESACDMLGEQGPALLPDQDKFASQWRNQLGLESAPDNYHPKKIAFPKEFRKLASNAPRSVQFWRYLTSRGYTVAQANWAAEAYQLHYAISGRYSYRVIIPVFSRLSQLMTWTGRSISPSADVRYLTLSTENSVAPTGELLLGLQLFWKAKKTRCLVVCEGPFDAVAVSVLGYEAGVWGTCFFGLECSSTQADLLCELSDSFERIRLMLDPTAMLRVLRMRERLPRRCRSAELPSGLKDPGELIGMRGGRDFVLSLAA